MEITDQQARAIAARIREGRDYPPSLAQIKRVLQAAADLGVVNASV